MTTSTTSAPTHLVELADGRHMAVDVAGDPDGATVVLLHSSPGSRRLDPDPAVTALASVRLITVDRAGYGGSSPLPADVLPTIAGAADDTAAVLDHLGVSDAAVVGWSHGGRVAAAVAARHPDRVRGLAVVGTPSPEDLSWAPEEQQAMLDPLRAEPLAATARLAEIMSAMVGGDPDDGLGFVAGEADAALLGDADVRSRVVAMLAEAFRHGPIGCAADIVADQIAPWGFDPASIGAPTHLFYSEDDFVPPHHASWWADRLVDATTHTTAGVGHLLLITEWARILTALGHPS